MQKHIVRICDLMGAWIDREAYLVSEVDAALAERDERIATLIVRLHAHGDIETDEEEALRGEEVK